MLIGIRRANAERTGDDHGTDINRSGRITFFEHQQVVGHGRILSSMKIAFAALVRFDMRVDDDMLSEIISPFLDEFVLGVLLLLAPDSSGMTWKRGRHLRVRLSAGRCTLVLIGRRPRLIDMQFVILCLGQWRLLQPFVHNRLCHQLLHSVAAVRAKKPRNGDSPRDGVPVILQSARAPRDSVISLVDSSRLDSFRDYAETVGCALRRYGIQFHEVDIAGASVDAASLPPSPLILIGQRGVFTALNGREKTASARILNFDCAALRIDGGAPLSRLPGLRKVQTRGARVGPVKLFFDGPITFWAARQPQNSEIVLDDGDHPYFTDGYGTYHCLFNHAEAVLSPCGSASEALFLIRGVILELCTRPIAAKECPRFLLLKLDDAMLEKSVAHLLEISRTGVHTNVGLFLNDVPLEAITEELRKNERFSFAPHSAGWKHSYWYDAVAARDYAPEELRRNVEHIAAQFAIRGIAISRVANLHFYALQKNAVPFLRLLGIDASMMYASARRRPAYLESYQFGPDAEGLFRMSAEDHSSFRYHPLNTWDFLKRCANPDGRGNVEKAIARAHRSARRAFIAGFPAILSTHEFRMLRFRPPEMRDIFEGTLDRLKGDHLAPSLCSPEEVADYLQENLHVGMVEASWQHNRLVLTTERPPRIDFGCRVYHNDRAAHEVMLGSGSLVTHWEPAIG